MNWAQEMIDFASKQAVRIARNYASELCICDVVSADDNGDNASIRWNGTILGSDLVVQTPFTIENVIEVPQQGNPRHHHNIESNLVDRIGVTSLGDTVLFIPAGVDISSAQLPDGTYDMEILATLIGDLDVNTLSINHNHSGKTSMELPKVRIWRGVKAGDSVLVLKVNPSCFVILCRVNLSNEPGSDEVEVYDDFDTTQV